MTRTRSIRSAIAAVAALALALGLVACGGGDSSSSGGGGTTTAAPGQTAAITKNPDNASTTLTIGSKNFTEQQVLGEIYAQALAAAGYKVSKELNLGDEQTALKALKGGEIDGYPEYTGTALLSFFEVPTKDLPKDPTQAYDEVKSKFAEQGITAFPPTPFTSSNEVAVTQQTAQKLGLKNISDLAGKSQDLTLYGSPECRGRDDCLRGLENVYGLKFKKFVPVDIAQRHEVLTNGDADISIVFTTDPQIARNREVLLEGRQGHVPAVQLDVPHEDRRRRQGRPGPREDDRPGEQEPRRRASCRSSTRASTSTRRRRSRPPSDYLQQFDLVSSGSCSRTPFALELGEVLVELGHVRPKTGQVDDDALLRGACEDDDRLLVGRGVLLAVRDPRRHVHVVARLGLDAALLAVLKEDEDGMAAHDVDAGLGLPVVVVGGDHAGPHVVLAHPDVARPAAAAGDGLEAAHPGGLRRVLGQLVVAGVVQPRVPGGGAGVEVVVLAHGVEDRTVSSTESVAVTVSGSAATGRSWWPAGPIRAARRASRR